MKKGFGTASAPITLIESMLTSGSRSPNPQCAVSLADLRASPNPGFDGAADWDYCSAWNSSFPGGAALTPEFIGGITVLVPGWAISVGSQCFHNNTALPYPKAGFGPAFTVAQGLAATQQPVGMSTLNL